MPPAPGDSTDAPPASHDEPRAVLEAVAEAALPDTSLADVAPLPGEGRNIVGSVTTAAGERFVLKCAPDVDATVDLRREAAVTNVVRRRTGVPVPSVVDAAFDPVDAPAPYLLFRWVAGQSLGEVLGAAPPPVHVGLFRELGETMAALHAATEYDAPGEIVPTGIDAFEVEPADSWPETFARELADHVEALGGTRFEALAEELWTGVSGRLPTLETGEPPVLLHGDFGEGNVIFEGTAVSGVLDWERAFVGHPEYDLCRAEVRYFWNQWGRRDALGSMLYAGYRSRRNLADGFAARRRLYLATFYLMSLSTFEDWGPRYADDLDSLASRLAGGVRGVLETGEPPGSGAPP